MSMIAGIRSSDIYPAHREKLERWAQRSAAPSSSKEFISQDREIQRIFRYYRHMGLLPKVESPCHQERLDKTRQIAAEVSSCKLPGSRGDILAGTRLADDVLLVPRHFLYLIPPTEWLDLVAKYLYVGAGSAWSALSLYELYRGKGEHARAEKIGDKEGMHRAKVRMGSGALISGASLSYLGGAISRHLEAGAQITSGLFSGANILFGAGSLFAIGSSVAGVLRCDRFRNRLDDYLRHPTLSIKDRLRGALSFLKDSLCVTPEESQQILEQIEADHPDLEPEQKEALFCQKCTDLAETKIKYVKRRTSNQSLHKILHQADAILQKLDDPRRVEEGIYDATLLVYDVRKDNMNKKASYVMGFLASLISVIALGVMVFFHLEALAIMLYGLSAAICLGMAATSLLALRTTRKEIDLASSEENG